MKTLASTELSTLHMFPKVTLHLETFLALASSRSCKRYSVTQTPSAKTHPMGHKICFVGKELMIHYLKTVKF